MDTLTLFEAKYLVFIIVIIAGVYWVTLPKEQKIKMFVFGVITAVVAFALTRLGGAIYFDPRPFVDSAVTPIYPHAANNGFPSDHTALAFTAAATVFYMNKKFGLVLLFLASLVGASRVLGYIHSFTDILGSIVFVAIAYGLAYYFTPKILTKINKHKASKV